jgi:glycosyltransferase involved in cell wall biosynthesis
MSKLEILVATMHQKDLSKIKEMNIKCDVIFANQADEYSYVEEKTNLIFSRMVTTSERGVSKNRNLALSMAKNEICLLGDDDVNYVDDCESIILNAFNELSQADIIIFNIDTLGKKVSRRMNTKIKKVKIFNFMNYGSVRIAFRKEKILRKNIWFSLKFGGGATYGAGEDSLFLREALQKKLKIYTYPAKIADVKQIESTWFEGYNSKFFFDKGAFYEAAFPKLKYLVSIYYAWRFKTLTDNTFLNILRCMFDGMKDFRKDS